jgi:cell division protein FtsB
MLGNKTQSRNRGVGGETGDAAGSGPIPNRALDWTLRAWRPAGTAVAVGLALLLTWHVVNGKHGLSGWQQQRTQDKQLQQEIKDLQDENARLHTRIERLKSDPDAMGILAREKLHYAKPNEVIVTLQPDPKMQPQTGASGK